MNGTIQPGEQILACRYISGQLDKLMGHLQGARTAKDREDVHQVRVSCRRMRAAMRLFEGCFDAKRAANWQKRLKQLLTSFGRARDLDVQIAFLAEQLKSLSPERKKLGPGIRRMLLRRRQQRDAVQPKIIKAIDTIRKKQVLTDIHLEMEKILFVLTSEQPSVQCAGVCQRAHEQIRTQVGQLMDRRGAMDDPGDIGGHHKVRIAAKKLRYVMEICSEVMEEVLKPAIKTVKKVQTLLGDIHDCDVWDSDIERFIETERQRTIDFYGTARGFSRMLPGLEYLKSERHSQRQELFQQAQALFGQLEQEAFWQKLLESLQAATLQTGATHEDTQDEQATSEPDA